MSRPRTSILESRQSLSHSASLSHMAASGKSALPVPNTGLRASRMATTQPTYDFLSGDINTNTNTSMNGNKSSVTRRLSISAASPSQTASSQIGLVKGSQSLRGHRSAPEPSLANEEFRAKIHSLQYEIDSLKQEQKTMVLKHDLEVKDAVARTEEVYRSQRAEEERRSIPRERYDQLNTQLHDAQAEAINIKTALEKEIKRYKDESRIAADEVRDLRNESESMQRAHEHEKVASSAQQEDLEKEVAHLRSRADASSNDVSNLSTRLSQREKDHDELEAEVLRLRNLAGGAESLPMLRQELASQQTRVQDLETTNRQQSAQLQLAQQEVKTIQLLEMAKTSLEARLRTFDDNVRELSQVRVQKQALEDERHSWTTYLEQQGEKGFANVSCNTPEEVVRALVKQQLDNATLTDQIGVVRTELLERDLRIKALETDKQRLEQVEKQKTEPKESVQPATIANESRARKTLERQRALALKEVEFLRQQLQSYDAEEEAFHSQPEKFDAAKKERIANLETQLDDSRGELAKLTNEMTTLEVQVREMSRTPPPFAATTPKSPLKRPHEETSSPSSTEAHGQLVRKYTTLQDEHNSILTSYKLAQADLAALKKQMASLQSTSRTRVLSLRSNPTDDFERIKRKEVLALRAENADLLALLGKTPAESTPTPAPSPELIPSTTLEPLRNQITELHAQVADKEKRMLRLKQIWSLKSLEFREAVYSLLGWKMDFRAGGKFALSLNLARNSHDTNDDDDDDDMKNDDGGDECLIFDGENGTMKVGGGGHGDFARQIGPLTKEWVQGKRYIPGLMASILLSKVDDGTLMM